MKWTALEVDLGGYLGSWHGLNADGTPKTHSGRMRWGGNHGVVKIMDRDDGDAVHMDRVAVALELDKTQRILNERERAIHLDNPDIRAK